jgi:hypothetical protein
MCSPLKQQPSTDHLGPLLVPAGSDSFSNIGLPHTTSSSSSSRVWDPSSLAAGQQQWLEAVARVWPGSGAAGPKQQQQKKGEGGHGSSAVAFSSTYLEEGGWCSAKRCAVLCCAVLRCVTLFYQAAMPVLNYASAARALWPALRALAGMSYYGREIVTIRQFHC